MQIRQQRMGTSGDIPRVTRRAGIERSSLDRHAIERSFGVRFRPIQHTVGEFPEGSERACAWTIRGGDALPNFEAPISSCDDKRHSGQNTTRPRETKHRSSRMRRERVRFEP